MSAPGKWDTHQQLRSKALAVKEASNSTSKPTKIERVQIPVEEPKVPAEVKIEVPVEVVAETALPVEEPIVEVEVVGTIAEEAKVELKPISKKNKNV